MRARCACVRARPQAGLSFSNLHTQICAPPRVLVWGGKRSPWTDLGVSRLRARVCTRACTHPRPQHMHVHPLRAARALRERPETLTTTLQIQPRVRVARARLHAAQRIVHVCTTTRGHVCFTCTPRSTHPCARPSHARTRLRARPPCPRAWLRACARIVRAAEGVRVRACARGARARACTHTLSLSATPTARARTCGACPGGLKTH